MESTELVADFVTTAGRWERMTKTMTNGKVKTER